MKRKTLTFLIAFTVYSILYFIILLVVENDYNLESKLMQCLFFGVGMGIFETFLRSLLIKSLKK